MKKLSIFAAIAAAVVMSSCGGRAPKGNLKTELDTVAYAAGMANTQGLKEYLVQRMDVDTTYLDQFIKGLVDGANAGDDSKTKAYYAGVQIGQQVSNQMVKGLNYQIFGEDSTGTISRENFIAGFVDGVRGKGGLMTVHEADSMVLPKLQELRQREINKRYTEWKQQNVDFMAEVAKKEGIKSLGDGIYYTVEVEGKGALPADSNVVSVHYEGKLIDGTVFDSSYKREKPNSFAVNQVIPGWTKALLAMPVGSKWTVYIPQEQAYGPADMGTIKPFSALVFTVELLNIEK